MNNRYRPSALAQIDRIFSCLVERNPDAADRVISRIKHSIDLIGEFPLSGAATESPDIRRLPIVRYPYVVFYTIDERAQEVIILRVRHTSQDLADHPD